ncbi:MAG: hypothetical protein HKN01_05925 [Acidimicrobiia bacterium]|nr:hypothetical protein [Acidimicrobiia bacterium]
MTTADAPLFTSIDDANRFLVDRFKLWGLWVAALALLVSLTGWLLIGATILALINLGALARPLHARAEVLVPEDEKVGGTFQAMIGRGTRRDRLAREIMYGARPLRQAIDMTGKSPLWIVVHWAIVGVTFVAFGFVFLAGWFA